MVGAIVGFFDGGWNESSCLLPIQYQCRCGGKLVPSLVYTVYFTIRVG